MTPATDPHPGASPDAAIHPDTTDPLDTTAASDSRSGEVHPNARRRWRIPLAVAGILALAGVGAAATVMVLDQGERSSATTADSDAPEVESAAAEAPEHEEQAAALDLHAVAWHEEAWRTTCTGTEQEPGGIGDRGERQPVYLEPDDPDQEWGLGWAHRNPHDPGIGTPLYQVDIDGVVYGDLTGDGNDDAVFLTTCTPGNFVIQHVEVWTQDDGALRHLPVVASFDRHSGTVDRVELVDGRLRLHHRAPEPGDDMPHLNGYPYRVVSDLTFDDGHWSWNEISRDGPPPVRDDGIDGLDLALPGNAGTWEHAHRSDWHDPVVAYLEGAWGTSLTVAVDEAPPIDVALDEQRSMYDEFGYDVSDPWFEEVDVPGTDRAVWFEWRSPSGDTLNSTVLFEVQGYPVRVHYSVYVEDIDHSPDLQAFEADTLASLQIDPDRFLHAIGR